ncbi:MAG: galactose mutarotase [Muribaculaceae bacterium]|nr:galactose mutarotase [Muribaculaceae bacterium]
MKSIRIDTHETERGEITTYELINASGASVKFSSLGAGILEIKVPDRDGNLADVVLGYKDLKDYFYDGPCAGKVPGRYANRICKGHLDIDGKVYQLNINNGPNHLHGGPENFASKIWDCEMDGDTVVFSLESPDGDENYPGNLMARIAYTWSDDNVLKIELGAVTDAPTVVNLTNHTYFNMAGEDRGGTALNQVLQLNCSRYLPTDDTLIPSGEMVPVEGTPMDFTEPKVVGRDIKQDFPALNYGKGYDNCWVIDGYEDGDLHQAAVLCDKGSGRMVEISTDQPAAQVYTGNWLEGSPLSKNGKEYHDYDGVAIECQGMPDAPNHDNFPSQLLRPDEEYRRVIIFAFKVNE